MSKPSQRRSITERFPSFRSVPVRCPTAPMLSSAARRSWCLPQRRPPYLEALATALAFAFLIYLVLGGA